MNKVYGILVVYYDEYFDKSVSQFRKILERVSEDNELIIITNQGEGGNALSPNILLGTNSAWEFSAWDEAVEYVKSKYVLKPKDVFILANDTFCHHRIFNSLTSFLFVSEFKNLFQRNERIVGELCTINEKFNIDNHVCSGWLSTYLFGCSFNVLEKLLPLNSATNDSFTIIQSECRIEIPTFSLNIIKHLENWVFPQTAGTGWYKSKEEVGELILKMKIRAIFNEKMLSKNASANNVEIVDVYRGIIKGLIKKLSRRVFNKLKKKK
jgi:hypothetical protein